MSVDGNFSASITVNDRRTVGLSGENMSTTVTPFVTFGDGTSQLDVLYQNTLAMTAGVYALDLYGVLLDGYGSTVNMLRIKGWYVKNTSSHTITMGAGSAAMTTLLNAAGTLTFPAGSWMMGATPESVGWAITPTTADTLNFTGTGTDTFQVVIAGLKS